MLVLLLALTAGQSADTLRLAAGVHPGPLVIERPTIVLGDSGAVVRGDGLGSVVVIRAGGRGSIIRGLRIEHSGRTPETDDAGVMVAADSVVLEDLIIRDILFGVYLRQVRGAVVRRVDVPEGGALFRVGVQFTGEVDDQDLAAN